MFAAIDLVAGETVTIVNESNEYGGVFLNHISFHDGHVGHPAWIRILNEFGDPIPADQDVIDNLDADPEQKLPLLQEELIARLNIPLDGMGNVMPTTIGFSAICRKLIIEAQADIQIGVRWEEVDKT